MVGEGSADHRQYLEECDVVAPVPAADPAFARFELDEMSSGGVFLTGSGPAQADLDRLQEEVAWAVGESRARVTVSGVEVKP